jgi:hypothetical protein
LQQVLEPVWRHEPLQAQALRQEQGLRRQGQLLEQRRQERLREPNREGVPDVSSVLLLPSGRCIHT